MVVRAMNLPSMTLSRKLCTEVSALDKVSFTRATNPNTEEQSRADRRQTFSPGTDIIVESFMRSGIDDFPSNDELSSVVYIHGDDSHLHSTYVSAFFPRRNIRRFIACPNVVRYLREKRQVTRVFLLTTATRKKHCRRSK